MPEYREYRHDAVQDFRVAKSESAEIAREIGAELLQIQTPEGKVKPRVKYAGQIRDYPTWLAAYTFLHGVLSDQTRGQPRQGKPGSNAPHDKDEKGSTSAEQTSIGATDFGTNSFAENPEPRCPCILLLDVSGSMRGQPIALLNSGLVAFRDELLTDSLASKRVEIAVITFGTSVNTICPFTTAPHFQPPTLMAEGDTPMGAAIQVALDMLRDRKHQYDANGIAKFRPWIFMITDGSPTDEWARAAIDVKKGEEEKAFAFFAIGVEGANLDVLKQISHRQPLPLKGLRFRDLFSWLSSSLKSVSRSNPGDVVPLQNPAGWAGV